MAVRAVVGSARGAMMCEAIRRRDRAAVFPRALARWCGQQDRHHQPRRHLLLNASRSGPFWQVEKHLTRVQVATWRRHR